VTDLRIIDSAITPTNVSLSPGLVATGAKVVVSIWGQRVDDYAEAAALLADVGGLTAIEVNVSCPNIEDRRHMFAHSATATAEEPPPVHVRAAPAAPVPASMLSVTWLVSPVATWPRLSSIVTMGCGAKPIAAWVGVPGSALKISWAAGPLVRVKSVLGCLMAPEVALRVYVLPAGPVTAQPVKAACPLVTVSGLAVHPDIFAVGPTGWVAMPNVIEPVNPVAILP